MTYVKDEGADGGVRAPPAQRSVLAVQAPTLGCGGGATARGPTGTYARPEPDSPPAGGVPDPGAGPSAATQRSGGGAGPRRPVPCIAPGLPPRDRRRPIRRGRGSGPAPPVGVLPPGGGPSVGVPPVCAPARPAGAPGVGGADARGTSNPGMAGARGGPPHFWPHGLSAAAVVPSPVAHWPAPAARLAHFSHSYGDRPPSAQTGGPAAPAP